ncbi:hypothetical protein L914_01620, partial [Phytophthora nicotianae]
AGNKGVLARLVGRLDQLQREVSGLHERVDHRAFSSDLNEAFRIIRRVEGVCNHVRSRPWRAPSRTRVMWSNS